MFKLIRSAESQKMMFLTREEEAKPFNMDKNEPLNTRSMKRIVYKRIEEYAGRNTGRRYNLRYKTSKAIELIRSNQGSIGIDFILLPGYTVKVPKRKTVRINTGIRLLPNFRQGFITCSTSSMLSAGVEIRNGAIDNDYSGDISLVITNHNHDGIVMPQGTSIGQMIPSDLMGHDAEFLCPVPISPAVFRLDLEAVLAAYAVLVKDMKHDSYKLSDLGTTQIRGSKHQGQMTRLGVALKLPENLSKREADLFMDDACTVTPGFKLITRVEPLVTEFPQLSYHLHRQQSEALDRTADPYQQAAPPAIGPGIKVTAVASTSSAADVQEILDHDGQAIMIDSDTDSEADKHFDYVMTHLVDPVAKAKPYMFTTAADNAAQRGFNEAASSDEEAVPDFHPYTPERPLPKRLQQAVKAVEAVTLAAPVIRRSVRKLKRKMAAWNQA